MILHLMIASVIILFIYYAGDQVLGYSVYEESDREQD